MTVPQDVSTIISDIKVLDMKLEDPIPQFSYLVKTLKERFPNFGYLHVVEPIASGPEYADKSNDLLRKIWYPKTFISAGGHTRESAVSTAEENDDLVAFGRLFIANVGADSTVAYSGIDNTTEYAAGSSHTTSK